MVCVLKRLSAAAVDELRESPGKALALMDDNADADYPLEEVKMGGCLGFLLRLTPVTVTQIAERPEGDVPQLPVDDPDRMETEVWDTINYLLTGTVTEGEPPAAFLVKGGTELESDDETDLRLLTPAEVAEIDDYVRSLSLDDLRARIDIPRMVKARLISKPRGGATPEKDTEYFDSVLRDFEDLRTFLAETKEQSKGLLVMLN